MKDWLNEEMVLFGMIRDSVLKATQRVFCHLAGTLSDMELDEKHQNFPGVFVLTWLVRSFN